ncbi:MAG: Uma2 family endonuclease [Terriglobia bacterium]
MATKTLLTIQEFMPLLEARDARYELVEGRLVTLSPTMLMHNLVRDGLLVILMRFVDGHKLGTVISMQPFHLFGQTVRVPDVAFVRKERELPPRNLPEGAPDLAIEVISPSNTAREMDQRISDYFGAGCQRVWIVYPEHQEVYIHGLSGVVRRTAGEQLQDAELLPGFSVTVASIFE